MNPNLESKNAEEIYLLHQTNIAAATDPGWEKEACLPTHQQQGSPRRISQDSRAAKNGRGKVPSHFLGEAILLNFISLTAYADFQSSIQSLVTGVINGVLPAIVMYEAALAGLAFARKNPDAKEKVEATALGAVAVLGINGVWSFLKGRIN